MKIICTIVLSIMVAFCFGQEKDCTINLDSIQTVITDSSNEYFYDSLLVRFKSFDTTLTRDQLRLLYYGNCFYKGYSPYSTSKTEEKFTEFYKKKNYKKAIKFGQMALEENPINLRLINRLAWCYNYIGDDETGMKYAFTQYYPLLEVIKESCGSDNEFVVIKVDDEYVLMGYLDVETKGQHLTSDLKDVHTLKKNKLKLKALYFDVSIPFMWLRRQSE